MSELSRPAVAVTLLADDPTARRLVVSWPLLKPGLKGRKLHLEWSKVSGVDLHVVYRLAPVLLAHELCRPRGELDPEAVKVVNHVAAALLHRGRRV